MKTRLIVARIYRRYLTANHNRDKESGGWKFNCRTSGTRTTVCNF